MSRVQEHDTVCCSAGRRGLQLELAPDNLVRPTKTTVAPIASTTYEHPISLQQFRDTSAINLCGRCLERIRVDRLH